MSECVSLHNFCVDDEEQILELNAESVAATSPIDREKFQTMRSQGSRVTVAVKNKLVVAFLMAFTDGCEYNNTNYQWFSKRFKRFIYVDRIVVADTERGNGVGQLIYCDLLKMAQADQYLWIAAEINIVPPNDQSLLFHQKQGFIEVGQQKPAGEKTVSMQVKGL